MNIKIVPQTLYSSRALEILTLDLDRTGLDIVALQEVRWPGEGSQESGKFTLYYGDATNPEFGTGFLVRRNILSAIRDIKFGKRHDFIIVNEYGPTEASDDTIKDEFYEELECVFDRLSRYHMKIVLGDFNAKIDHVLVDKQWHSSIIDITSVRGLDCYSDHHLVRVKIRERDTKDDSEKFELKNLRNDEERLEYQIKITNRFETLASSESVGHLKKRQSRKWFDDECIDMVHKRKLAKMNRKRKPNEQNSEQLCSIRWETTRFLKNKKREYLKEKINDLESILNRWGNYFNQLLYVHGEEEIEENNLQTAEVSVEETSAIEVEMAIEKLKMYKATEMIKSGGEKLKEKIHRLLSLIWKQEALSNEWKESIIIPIYKKGDKTDCNKYRGISLLSTSYKILTNLLVSRLTPYIDEIIGDHQCAFRRNRSTIDQIFSLRQILEKKWEYNGTVHQLYVDFKKAYDSIKRGKLYSILMNFGIPKKLVRLIGMCLNGKKSRVRVGKQVSYNFEIHNGLKQGDALSPLLFNLVLEHAIKSLEDKEGVQLNGIHKLLVYADDIVLLGDSEGILKDKMHILRSNTRKLGLEVNVNKTKYMVTRRNTSGIWENNINHDLREVDYTGDDWKTLAQDKDVWRAYVRTAMNLRVR
ncbi:hypothetical protein C0J52_16903 [Blattella germanica]|nr:hypothetical protein C0J52_16903 [Blattella germanica]